MARTKTSNTTIQPQNKEQAKFASKTAKQNLLELQYVATLPPITIDDTEEIVKRTSDYFERCGEYGRIPTVTGLSVGIGLDREKFYNWVTRKPNHPTCQFLKKVQTIIAENLEQGAMVQKINPVTSIFLLKANHAYREVTEKVVTHKAELGELKSEKELIAEIDNDIIEVEAKEI